MALGIVLTPYGKIPGSFPAAITQSRGGNGEFLNHDPYYNQRGQCGWYHDTQLGSPKPSLLQRAKRALGLGAIPTDFQIASTLNYTPVMSSWVWTDQGYIQPPPWRPSAPLAGFRDSVEVPGVSPAATVDDVVQTMNAHNDRVFALTLVSTTAVAVSAMITIFRTLKLIREGKD